MTTENRGAAGGTLGLYIHIPFCASKCAYCDFYSVAGAESLMDRYTSAVERHIAEWSPQLAGYLIDTVYFGGGTPSYFGAARLISILDALKKQGRLLKEAEITLEANPDSTSYHELQKLRRAGFNRISLGVQSSDDGLLRSLGRRHDFRRSEQAAEDARKAGFYNLSIDLIYGLPSQTREDWAETLTKAMALRPEHVSCYGLKIEPGTPLYELREAPFIPDGDTQADMYLYAVDALERLGYYQYEISNFAKKGFRSAHNLKYWLGQEYIGFGAAAHSFVGGQRFSCVADAVRYCEGIEKGAPVIEGLETITDFERAGEYLMLGLRTSLGVCEEEYRKLYRGGFDRIAEKLDYYTKHGFMQKTDGRWSFTPRGFLVSNTIIGDVLDAQAEQRAASAPPWDDARRELDEQMSFFSERGGDVEWFRGM